MWKTEPFYTQWSWEKCSLSQYNKLIFRWLIFLKAKVESIVNIFYILSIISMMHIIFTFCYSLLNLIPGLGRSPREGKVYPLQYSSLENFMDCIIYEVTKNRTQLSDFHFNKPPNLWYFI